jgi:quercetin dioxygenase-like cupin family protein
MRRIVTGADASGRSTVLTDGPPPTAFHSTESSAATTRAGPWTAASVAPREAVVHQLWATGPDVAKGAADPTPAMGAPEFDTPTGATSWIVTEMGPHLEVPMHHTTTVDYGFVARGQVELGLESGPVTLRAGDAVLVDAVRHSWRAGPDGCTIVTVQLGLRVADR